MDEPKVAKKRRPRKPYKPRKREWYEDEPDIRITEPLPETLLASVSAFSSFNKRIGMDALKFDRYMEHQTRREAYAQKSRTRRRVQKAFIQLERAEFVTRESGKYRLTLKGWVRYAWNYSRLMKKIKKKKESSKDWFIVIFDIPEDFRRFRDSLRRTLYNLGFRRLQHSVFVSHDPDSFEFISKIISQTELFDRVKLIVGKQIV